METELSTMDYKFFTKSVSCSDLEQALNEIAAKDGVIQNILPGYYSSHPIYKSLDLSSVLIIYKLPKQ